jgi:hypothetical protein
MTDDRSAAPPPPAGTSETLFNLARGAKGIALLCFLLPWVTVSCSGDRVLSMSGYQLATGTVRPPAGVPIAFTRMQAQSTDPFVMAAALLIVAALAVSFLLHRRHAAAAGTGACATAAAILAYEVLIRIRGGLQRRIDSGSESAAASASTDAGGLGAEIQREFAQAAQSISVETEAGFWLCLLALLAAVVLDTLVLSRRTEP